jgi:hypothetical protein
MWTVIIFSNKDCSFFDLSLGRKGRNFSPTLLSVVVPNNFSFITIRWAGVFAMNITSKRLLHDIFHIGPGISPRLPYKPDSEAEWLIWVVLHWTFSIIDLYIAECNQGCAKTGERHHAQYVSNLQNASKV